MPSQSEFTECIHIYLYSISLFRNIRSSCTAISKYNDFAKVRDRIYIDMVTLACFKNFVKDEVTNDIYL